MGYHFTIMPEITLETGDVLAALAVVVASSVLVAVLVRVLRARSGGAIQPGPSRRLPPLHSWVKCVLGGLDDDERSGRECALRHLQTLEVPAYDVDNGEEGHVSADWERIKSNTHCVFAKTSRVMGGARWDPKLTLEENVVRSIPLLVQFNMRMTNGANYDGFVIEVEDEAYGDTIEHFGSTVTRILETLSIYDPEHDHAMFGPIHLNVWNFTFGGTQASFFISSFAPCYGKQHSRFGYDTKSSFVLLQPEISFSQKGISLDEDPQSVRHLIRKRFQQAGQPYVLAPVEA